MWPLLTSWVTAYRSLSSLPFPWLSPVCQNLNFKIQLRELTVWEAFPESQFPTASQVMLPAETSRPCLSIFMISCCVLHLACFSCGLQVPYELCECSWTSSNWQSSCLMVGIPTFMKPMEKTLSGGAIRMGSWALVKATPICGVFPSSHTTKQFSNSQQTLTRFNSSPILSSWKQY